MISSTAALLWQFFDAFGTSSTFSPRATFSAPEGNTIPAQRPAFEVDDSPATRSQPQGLGA